MITKACVWPHSSRVKNPKHATHSSLVIGTSLALPAISDLFVGQKNSINTFPLSNSQTDYESPEFPRAASSTLSVSWLDFFFIPLGFFFFFPFYQSDSVSWLFRRTITRDSGNFKQTDSIWELDDVEVWRVRGKSGCPDTLLLCLLPPVLG